MTAYLQPGDRIMLAVPDFRPGQPIQTDREMWREVYSAWDVHVEHVAVHHALSHPVVIAVIRDKEQP